MELNDQSEFYVGYLPNAPASYTKKVRLFVLVLLLAIPLIALLLVQFQRGFISSTYDYANLSELTGALITDPFPALQVKINDAHGNEILQTIPLVAFGKKGVQEELASKGLDVSSPSLDISVVGNLIFYDGKTLMEVKEWGESAENSNSLEAPKVIQSNVSVTGEILDAKCFFGVMKPAYGKPHRSCAARCLSGGISPVLSIHDPSGQQHYYLITGPDHLPINAYLLPSVAQIVTLQGTILQYQDWEVLQLDQKTLDQLASLPLDLTEITFCLN